MSAEPLDRRDVALWEALALTRREADEWKRTGEVALEMYECAVEERDVYLAALRKIARLGGPVGQLAREALPDAG